MKVWNWEGFWSYFTNLYLLEGALWTIGLTVSTLFLGGIIGGVLALVTRRRDYPFGPFMLVGALLAVVLGQPVMSALYG